MDRPPFRHRVKHSIASRLGRFRRDETGASAVVMAVALPLLAGALFMGVEAGHWRQANAKLQAAADEAAMAAAREFIASSDLSLAQRAADAAAIGNGASLASKIVITEGINGGTYDGADGLELSLRQDQERFFSKVFGNAPIVRHSLEAKVVLGGETAPQCVLTLSTTASPGIRVSGSSDLSLDNCGLHSNSTADPSFVNSGSGSINADCISASGTIHAGSRTSLDECTAPAGDAGRVRDPYANVDMPANWTSLPCASPKWGGKTVRIEAGKRYCGSISEKNIIIEGSGWVIVEGGLNIKANGSITGDSGGNAILFANGGYMDANVNGGDYDLTAMSTGPYAGILMYADRHTTPSWANSKINGNASAELNGALYFPTVNMTFNGAASLVSDCLQIIANTVEFTGNSEFTNTNCPKHGATEINRIIATSALLVH